MGVRPRYNGALDPALVAQSAESGSALDPSLLDDQRGYSQAWQSSRLLSNLTPALYDRDLGAPRWAAPTAPAAAIGLRQMCVFTVAAAYPREVLRCQDIYRESHTQPRPSETPNTSRQKFPI